MVLDSTDCLCMDVLKAFFGERWSGLFLAADRGMLETLGLLLKVGLLGQEISVLGRQSAWMVFSLFTVCG